MKKQDFLHASWVDQLLAAAGAIAAAYSSGIAVSRPGVAVFFAIAMAAAALIGVGNSFWISKTKFAKLDSVLVAIVMIVMIVFARQFNNLLPENGYPRTILIGGILSWMILGGMLVSFRDHTLLFLSVPCIALFGFVGSWDTFGGAVWLFFIFLICSVTLFARAHMRTMLRYAASAGEPDYLQLQKGPWRWMAGPEWALVSAMIVVGLSVLGAPAFQSSVQVVAGAIKIELPTNSNRPSRDARYETTQDGIAVGRGPAPNLSEIPVLSVKIERPMLLRGSTLGEYEEGRWKPMIHAMTEDDRRTYGDPRAFVYDGRGTISNPESVPFEIVIQSGVHRKAYTPGEYQNLKIETMQFGLLFDGTILPNSTLDQGVVYSGSSFIAPEGATPTEAGPPPVPPWSDTKRFYTTKGIHESVQAFARKVVEGKKTDYEKAIAIKEAIGRQCQYDLQAPRTPPGRDPVEFFLFESRRGYCDLFASAFALMARAAGLPSRFVTGFLMQPQTPDGKGFYVVQDSDYHAWAQVFFPGYGWVDFDATEDAAVAPGSERGGIVPKTKAWYEIDDGEAIVNTALIGCGILLAVILLWPTKKTRLDPKVAQLKVLESLFVKYQKAVLRLTGRGRFIFETPTEYLQRMRPLLGENYNDAAGLANDLERLIFSGATPSPEELKALNLRIQTLSRAKKAEVKEAA